MNDQFSPSEGLLAALLMPAIDPLFSRPLRLCDDSVWIGHVPFARWLVAAARPRVLVEVGSHREVSYSAFCEAVLQARLGTRCFAIGPRKPGGDDGADDFDRFHARHFSAFSRLLFLGAESARSHVEDNSVDLLHIDGVRGADAVGQDFSVWLTKLSDRGVVLLHGINERALSVSQWFTELRHEYPSFEFIHGHGLGVLAVGRNAPSDVAGLCALTDPAVIQTVRERFGYLGERWRLETEVSRLRQDAQSRVDQLMQEARKRYHDQALADAGAMRSRAARRSEQARRAAAVAWQEVNRLSTDLRAAVAERDTLKQQRDLLAAERARLAKSLAWRATAPLRRIGDRIPERLREQGADALKLVFWAATGRLRRALAHRARVRRELAMLASSPLFDPVWYLARYPDVAATGMDPALHFVSCGGAEGRDPGPMFDASEYAARYPDVAATGVSPVLHYIESGAREGRIRVPVAEIMPAPPPPAPSVSDPAAWAVPTESGSLTLPPPRIVFIAGEPGTPGEVYRIGHFARAAERAGARTHVMPYNDVPIHREKLLGADIVFIWRASWTLEIKVAVDTARAIGAKLMFDLDDLMVEPKLARAEVIDGMRTLNVSPEALRGHYTRMRDTMTNCGLCIATTDELAWHIRQHGNPTVVLPNGYDRATFRASRAVARRRRLEDGDGLIRIGYAAGSRTHQRDFAQAAPAIARILRERPECRLVLFKSPIDTLPVVDTAEFPDLAGLDARIEWRDMVPLERLPEEVGRFDINIAPLEVGNEFCEAKSELKYFEAALVDVCTVASPTGPFRRAITHGRTGMLATTTEEWHAALATLVADAKSRRRLARAAYLDVLWPFGPERRAEAVASILQQVRGGPPAARAFAYDANSSASPRAAPEIPDGTVVLEYDQLGDADVTVVVPLYNYAHHVEEALASVLAQSLMPLDLVIVDDASTDASLDVARDWVERNARHLNRAVLIRNVANAGLGLARNAGFAAAETPYVLPLDADNRLRPDCCATLLRHAEESGAAFTYPLIREFGDASHLRNPFPYDPARLIGVPFVDAMALVSVAAWAGVGGYSSTRLGWEDYDFWCRMAEAGLTGFQVPGQELAEYRVHGRSMLQTITEAPGGKPRVVAEMTRRHPWLSIVDAKRQPARDDGAS